MIEALELCCGLKPGVTADLTVVRGGQTVLGFENSSEDLDTAMLKFSSVQTDSGINLEILSLQPNPQHSVWLEHQWDLIVVNGFRLE